MVPDGEQLPAVQSAILLAGGVLVLRGMVGFETKGKTPWQTATVWTGLAPFVAKESQAHRAIYTHLDVGVFNYLV